MLPPEEARKRRGELWATRQGRGATEGIISSSNSSSSSSSSSSMVVVR